MSTGLFAGLARKALQATAIRPRLPSRYEGLASGLAEGAAGPSDMATTAPAATAASMRFSPSAPLAPPTQITERPPVAHEPAAALPRADRSAAEPAADAASLLVAGVRSAPSAVGLEQQAVAPPADGPTARSVLPGAGLPQPLTTAHQPAVQGVLTGPQTAPSSLPSPAAEAPALSLRQRIAEQLPRPLDEHMAAPSRVAPRAVDDGGARTAVPLNARPAPPSVEITIGSIDIVLTQAPVAAPARAAAPPAGPAVQSLDAYLQARQRRGGA
jgi:hypothetical protein